MRDVQGVAVMLRDLLSRATSTDRTDSAPGFGLTERITAQAHRRDATDATELQPKNARVRAGRRTRTMGQNVAVSAAINNLHACYIGKWLQRLWTVGMLGNVRVQTSYKRRQIGTWRSQSWWVNDGMQTDSRADAIQPGCTTKRTRAQRPREGGAQGGVTLTARLVTR